MAVVHTRQFSPIPSLPLYLFLFVFSLSLSILSLSLSLSLSLLACLFHVRAVLQYDMMYNMLQMDRAGSGGKHFNSCIYACLVLSLYVHLYLYYEWMHVCMHVCMYVTEAPGWLRNKPEPGMNQT